MITTAGTLYTKFCSSGKWKYPVNCLDAHLRIQSLAFHIFIEKRPEFRREFELASVNPATGPVHCGNSYREMMVIGMLQDGLMHLSLSLSLE